MKYAIGVNSERLAVSSEMPNQVGHDEASGCVLFLLH
jgi:hypothetical protein